MLSMLFAAVVCSAQLNLLDDPKYWSGNTDRPGASITIDAPNGVLAANVISAEADQEHFPKLLRQAYDTPQDWREYTRLNARLRITSDDPKVKTKSIAFVFYDEQTRRTDLPSNEMTQQIIAHSIPVGEWVELKSWLADIRRASIRSIVLYLYERPPSTPHSFHCEVARLELEKVKSDADAIAAAMAPEAGTPDTAENIATHDGLYLELNANGSIAAVGGPGGQLGHAETAPAGLLVRDVASGGPAVSVGGVLTHEQENLRQTARLENAGLAVTASYRAKDSYLEVQGTVSDTRGQDRAVTVYLALPVAEAPWKWWDSAAASRTQTDDGDTLGYFERGVEYGLRGEHSKYPLGAITWPEHDGLTLAIRMDEPVVHRIAYIPRLRLFYAAFDFGLTPEARVEGRPLSEAPFRFLLYRHDPAWGFRAALQRYYDFFPEFFTKRTKREGGWYVWGHMKDTPGAQQAGFGFHWGPIGPDAVKYDNDNAFLALAYIEPELTQQTMGDFNEAPTVDEALSRGSRLAEGNEEELAKVQTLAYAGSYTPGKWLSEHSLRESLQTVSRAALVSANYAENGKPAVGIMQCPWMAESKWGAIFPCNLDPDIPGGKGWFARRVYIDYALRGMEEQGAHYDGVALDSFGGYNQHLRANYRREHFPYSDVPLSFSSTSERPVQVAAFASVKWVRQLANDMHAQEKVLMANCAWNVTPGWLTFAAPYLDIFGSESPRFDDPDFMRAIAYRKPCTDLPYTPRPAWEIPWHWLHGIYPGLGNDIEAMKRASGLLQELAQAGWEPITGARVKPEQVRIERFGTRGTVYLVLHNSGKSETRAEIEIDTKVIDPANATIVLKPQEQTLPFTNNVLAATLAPCETVALAIQRQ